MIIIKTLQWLILSLTNTRCTSPMSINITITNFGRIVSNLFMTHKTWFFFKTCFHKLWFRTTGVITFYKLETWGFPRLSFGQQSNTCCLWEFKIVGFKEGWSWMTLFACDCCPPLFPLALSKTVVDISSMVSTPPSFSSPLVSFLKFLPIRIAPSLVSFRLRLSLRRVFSIGYFHTNFEFPSFAFSLAFQLLLISGWAWNM